MKKTEEKRLKKTITKESFAFIAILGFFLFMVARKMGTINMVNTMMNTSYELLINTAFYIIAISVLMGALSELLTEFGVVAVANKLISPFMQPIYNLPGASIIGVFNTYFSDNPAILPLAQNNSFKSYFKKYQFYALANLGTSFGMGLIVSAFIIGIPSPTGESFTRSVVIGNLGAIVGSIVSTRLMLRYTKKEFGTEAECDNVEEPDYDIFEYREIREGSYAGRILSAALDGGQKGVDVGKDIIPGVLIICTIVQILTFGPSETGLYTGAANEGIALLPKIGEKLDFILKPIFGFENSALISVPITALGAAGAAIGLIPGLVAEGFAKANGVAVLTAMCMCWSGYLSTHVAMMESLGKRELAGKAIISHTIGGLAAGISANLLFKLSLVIF